MAKYLTLKQFSLQIIERLHVRILVSNYMGGFFIWETLCLMGRFSLTEKSENSSGVKVEWIYIQH